ncbi:MAG: cyclopropane fatty acyl phospholipid synthase [Actinomycetota bacterium]
MDVASFGTKTLAGIGVTVGGDGPADIHIHDDRFYKRVLRDRELGLGEAYQEGWWSANQLDEFLAVAQEANLRDVAGPSPALIRLMIESRLGNRQTASRAKRNARAHYDIGNDLFERMLDKRMIYTCAYWRDADDLDSAQEAKLDLICRKLGLAPGMRVLDIGCGWGGFAQFAATRYDVHVTGISPASEQVDMARATTDGLPVQILQADYRELEGTYDRITSIGMMEHVGPRNLATFFDACDRLLTPDGMMLHHTIGSNEWQTHTDPWFDKYIFPGGVLPSLGQIARAAEKTWSIEDVHNFGPDYDRTLMAWHANISERWHEIPHYDDHFRRTWEYYLLGSAAGFRVRALQLFQVVFTKAKQRRPVYEAVR